MSAKTNPETRFGGRLGREKLFSALQNQPLVNGSDSIAKDLVRFAEVLHLPSNKEIITQDDYDTDIFLLVLGSVDVIINGRKITSRHAPTHLGEMALLEPTAKRSATVITREKSTVIRVSEQNFSRVANAHPEVWRRIASSLASRLRERSVSIHPPKGKPAVFLGSSSESAEVLRGLQRRLRSRNYTLSPWSMGVFEISGTAIESLIKMSATADFAILILSPDDELKSRGNVLQSPRDNVLFELGLFMGELGRERTFIVRLRSKHLRTPSDLAGVTCLEYEMKGKRIDKDSLSRISRQLKSLITSIGPR